MSRLGLVVVALVFALGCGKRPAPDIITRDRSASGFPGDVMGEEAAEPIVDAGETDGVDAGVCCPVRFALDARAEEVSASLAFSDSVTRYVMTRDAGQWEATVCTKLVRRQYWFQVGINADDPDAGVLLLPRLNLSVPTAPGVLGPEDVFDPDGAMSCEALDAGIYGAPFDAGVPDGG